MTDIAAIPMKTIGPIKISGPVLNEEVKVPLATFEVPLWPSTNRGARVSRATSEGIKIAVIDQRMTRSVLLEAPDAVVASLIAHELAAKKAVMNEEVRKGSRFAQLVDIHHQIVGNLIYLRFEFFTGDASGHNMATKAAEQLIKWLLEQYPALQYVSISGNYCADKKVSAVNGILGRGRYVVSEITISREVCQKLLKTTPEKIINLNIKKNLLGSIVAGGLRTANAHVANMLLAFYLATGQDAANIVEGSQAIVHAEMRQDDLYFSVTLPNIIVGTVGAGKGLDFVKENLKALGCMEQREPGENAERLAAITAATVLCGELSLLAAQTNPGELMRSHLLYERKTEKRS